MTNIAVAGLSAPAPARLTVLVGLTTVDKGIVVTELRRHHPDLFILVSVITRRFCPDEADGMHYHLASGEDFDLLIASGQMLEWVLIYEAHRYGTPRGLAQDRLDVGYPTLLEADLDGIR